MNRITQLFGIQYPIIQGGMVWCSGWELASAVSEAGGLGILGAGSMYPEQLENHILQCKKATQKPFGVNLPLLFPYIEEHIEMIIKHQVQIVFTSAGNPNLYTQKLKSHGITVVHVISNTKFALKAVAAGVDALVAEGFEAGGHNGREETTTLCLIPTIRKAVDVPLMAAGGIGSGKAMMAAFALGAEGVQVGSAFAVAEESSAHLNFKNAIINATEGDTLLSLKKLTPVRLLRNAFAEQIWTLEKEGANAELLKATLGKGRARMGIAEGDMLEGELEIGQISALIDKIQPASVILNQIWKEFLETKAQLCQINF